MRRIVNAYGYSVSGLQWAWQQAPFRTEAYLAGIMLPLALCLGHSGVERAMLTGSVLLVLVVELLNCGIEAAIDRISAEIHPLSKAAKDVGSAAVLVSLVNAGLVWFFIVLT